MSHKSHPSADTPHPQADTVGRHSHVSLSTPDTVAEAQQTQYVAFLFRAPYALDAYQLGFATGIREDYKLQQDKYDSLDLPVYMLDNYFKDPDLDRYLEVCRTHEPRVGVIGDAFTEEDTHNLVAAATEMRDELDFFEPIIVPKCESALDIIPDDIIVGYANGYSDLKPNDFSTRKDWYGRHVHILGGTPPKTYEILQNLTHGKIVDPIVKSDAQTATLADFDNTDTDTDSSIPVSDLSHTPANIVGVDWNGLHQWAMKGDYWHHEGNPWWRNADTLTVRASVRKGLSHIKQYWTERSIWPTATPANDPSFDTPLTSQAEPDIPTCSGCGTDTWTLETDAIVVEYEDGVTRAFCSNTCRDRVEYYDGAIPLNIAHQDIQYLIDRPRSEWVSSA